MYLCIVVDEQTTAESQRGRTPTNVSAHAPSSEGTVCRFTFHGCPRVRRRRSMIPKIYQTHLRVNSASKREDCKIKEKKVTRLRGTSVVSGNIFPQTETPTEMFRRGADPSGRVGQRHTDTPTKRECVGLPVAMVLKEPYRVSGGIMTARHRY